MKAEAENVKIYTYVPSTSNSFKEYDVGHVANSRTTKIMEQSDIGNKPSGGKIES